MVPVPFAYQWSHDDHKGGSSGGEHQHGDADLSHRVTVTLRLSVHVRGRDKWTIVPPSRSDHRVTGSHRINPLLVCTRSEALPETVGWCLSAGVHLLLAQKGGRGAGWRKRRARGRLGGLGGGGLCSTGVSGRETAVGHAELESPAEGCCVPGRSQPSTCQSPPISGLCFPQEAAWWLCLKRGRMEEEG